MNIAVQSLLHFYGRTHHSMIKAINVKERVKNKQTGKKVLNSRNKKSEENTIQRKEDKTASGKNASATLSHRRVFETNNLLKKVPFSFKVLLNSFKYITPKVQVHKT